MKAMRAGQARPRRFNAELRDYVAGILADRAQVRFGSMFGYPAWYVDGGLFACVYGDGIGIKVPETLAEELRKLARVHDFRPYGKPRMREWIELRPRRPASFDRDAWILDRSIEHVRSTRRTKPRRRARSVM